MAYGREIFFAQPDDLFTAEQGKPADVGLLFRQIQLGLEPAVRLLLAHQPACPKTVEGFVGLNTFAAQLPVGQGAHGQAGVPVGGHVGITGRIACTDIIGRGRGCGFGAVYHGRGAQERPGAAVGAFDVDSFHRDHSFVQLGGALILGWP